MLFDRWLLTIETTVISKKSKSIDSPRKIKNAERNIIIVHKLKINFLYSFQTFQILAIFENFFTIHKSKTKKIVASILVLNLRCNAMLQTYVITTRLLCKKNIWVTNYELFLDYACQNSYNCMQWIKFCPTQNIKIIWSRLLVKNDVSWYLWNLWQSVEYSSFH